MADYIKGDASTSYGDWRGTVSADISMMSDIEDIYTLAGREIEDGLVVGISAGWTSSKARGVSLDVEVFVYEPEAGEDSNMESLLAEYPKGSAIPVKEIHLHEVTPEQFALMFIQFDVQLRSRSLQGWDLRVTSLGDYPEQN